MTTVYVRHLRPAGLCVRGTRRFFAAHGLDWRAFAREGVDAATLRATGDAQANRLADIAERETPHDS